MRVTRNGSWKLNFDGLFWIGGAAEWKKKKGGGCFNEKFDTGIFVKHQNKRV